MTQSYGVLLFGTPFLGHPVLSDRCLVMLIFPPNSETFMLRW